jgi:hypothetical protein
MDSNQYEELCRHFIAEQTGLRAEDVKSIIIPNAKRPGLPAYQHQIDLYWETGDAIAAYLNIANAKWRGTEKVEQGEVLLLQQVRQQVPAHKAFMLTNVGFTAGAVAAAKDHGIALHIVTPNFDASELPRGDRIAIQEALRNRASQTTGALYSFHVENRGLGFGGEATTDIPIPNFGVAPGSGAYETRVVLPPSRSMAGPSINRSIRGGETRGGLDSRSGPRGGRGPVKK